MKSIKSGDFMKDKKQIGISILIMLGLLCLSSLVGILFQSWHWADTNIILVYILAVLMTSRFTKGYFYGIMSSIISTFLFNYFFTAPYYTLSVYDSKYFITFIVMTLTAIITSASTSRIQLSTDLANENARNMKTLYDLTNKLSDLLDYQSLSKVVIEIFSEVFDCEIGFICFQESPHYIYLLGTKDSKHEEILDDLQEYQSQFLYLRKPYKELNQCYHYPIYGIHKLLGVVILPKENVELMNDNTHKLLVSMIENVSLALDHIYSIKEQLKLKEATVKERYRSNLLRAISHDLRTPLSGIMGTSEMIMDMNNHQEETYQLAHGIYEEANWLYLLVENILSLTKVEEGKLVIHKQLEAVEEVIGSAVYHVTKNNQRKIEVHVPDDVLMVPMDAKLIQQVIINLLDNAMKHTPKDKSIYVDAYEKDQEAYIVVEDYGKVFENQNPKEIFEMFYTNNGSNSSDGSKGVGLGLTICKAIVEAHSGEIQAENCSEHQGARFIVKLKKR